MRYNAPFRTPTRTRFSTTKRRLHHAFAIASLFTALLATTPLPARADENADRNSARLIGRVVYLAEALQNLHGVKTVDEARHNTLALQTDDDQLIPIVEDVRGRAFRRDDRLRKMRVELLVRRYEGVPAVQIIRVFELTDEGRFELDYWCDICAIAMFELKACDCCQGPIELRRRPAADDR